MNVDDLRDAVISVLSHRIKLKPSIKYLESPVEYVKKQFMTIEEELSEKGGAG